MRCKEKKTMKDPVQYKMGKNKDRDAMKGKCEKCGTNMNKILSADDKKALA